MRKHVQSLTFMVVPNLIRPGRLRFGNSTSMSRNQQRPWQNYLTTAKHSLFTFQIESFGRASGEATSATDRLSLGGVDSAPHTEHLPRLFPASAQNSALWSTSIMDSCACTAQHRRGLEELAIPETASSQTGFSLRSTLMHSEASDSLRTPTQKDSELL